jgi:hypothetical protein
MKLLKIKFENGILSRKIKLASFKIAIKFYIRFSKPMRRAGGYENHMRNKIRYNYQIQTLLFSN